MQNSQQSKRMKRLLGNAFYLNVKFDQHTAKQSDVGKRDSELLDIKEGEILYSTSRNNKRSRKSFVLSHFIGVDGVDGVDNPNDPNHFEGIAQTEHCYHSTPKIDQGLVSCVSGVITIMNNSDKIIDAGDLLYLQREPKKKKRNRGIHKDKMRYCLTKMKNKDLAELYVIELEKKFKILEEKLKKKEKATREDMEEVYSTITYSLIDKLQVATAVSRAKAGCKLDILVYPRLD